MILVNVLRVLILIFCVAILPTESLTCYDCKDVADVTTCSTSKQCGQDESCFMDRVTTGNTTLFSLGCISNQQCSLHSGITTGSGSSLIGRSLTVRQDQRCHECCSTDKCAVQLCSHLKPTACIDDETLDCSRLNTLFDICTDISRAKSVCPRFCGLCNVVDGKWTPWSPWSDCSVSCETGTETRTRTCSNPAPAHGGDDCHGNSTTIRTCVHQLCPVHGGWSGWQQWGSCSVSCGVGMQRRYRNCTNPTPSRSGDHGFGVSIDDRLCYPGACSDGAWSGWNKWTNCSSVYGCNGMRTRSRSCSNPNPSPYGKECVGNSMQIGSCTNSDCHGAWSGWNEWTNCSSVYGCNGIRTRSRSCSNPNSSPYGKECVGDSIQIGSCTTSDCQYIDCMEIKSALHYAESGIYDIYLRNQNKVIKVYCDMDSDGGGWTVFQRRWNGTVDFYRTFAEYEAGFGDIDGEFWLGLKTIQELAAVGNTELRINLTASDRSSAYERYSHFYLSNGRNYTLNIDPGTGTAGDSGAGGLSHYNGVNFATWDKDNAHKCAIGLHGAGWHINCAFGNLNGVYLLPGTVSKYLFGQGDMIYYNFKQRESLKSAIMMLRRNK